MQQKKKSFCIG